MYISQRGKNKKITCRIYVKENGGLVQKEILRINRNDFLNMNDDEFIKYAEVFKAWDLSEIEINENINQLIAYKKLLIKEEREFFLAEALNNVENGLKVIAAGMIEVRKRKSEKIELKPFNDIPKDRAAKIYHLIERLQKELNEISNKTETYTKEVKKQLKDEDERNGDEIVFEIM